MIPWGHLHFLHFIYFQTVFSVLSFSSDASTYFQIEIPSISSCQVAIKFEVDIDTCIDINLDHRPTFAQGGLVGLSWS